MCNGAMNSRDVNRTTMRRGCARVVVTNDIEKEMIDRSSTTQQDTPSKIWPRETPSDPSHLDRQRTPQVRQSNRSEFAGEHNTGKMQVRLKETLV